MKKKTITRKGLLAAVTAMTFTPAAFAQIPVTVTSDVPGLQFHLEDITKYVSMIEQMKSQVQQLQQTYNSLTGSSGIGSLFNESQLEQMLPASWKNVYQSVENGGFSGISGSVSQILASQQQAMSSSVDDNLKTIQQERAQNAAYDKAIGEAGYDMTMQRLNNIEGLTRQIDSETNPKQIMDLQARIQGEQAAIQNEQTKLQLIGMLQQAQQRLVSAQQDAVAEKLLNGSQTTMATIGGSGN